MEQAQHKLRQLFSTIDSNDWGNLARCFHHDVTYVRPGYPELVGKEAVLAFYRNTRIVACGQHVLEKVVAEGNNVACRGTFTGTAKDGRKLRIDFADFYEFSGDLISSRKTFFFTPAI